MPSSKKRKSHSNESKEEKVQKLFDRLEEVMRLKRDVSEALHDICEEEEELRRIIKSQDYVEPDSLLILSDDAILDGVLPFLDCKDMAKFEVCKRLKTLIGIRCERDLEELEKKFCTRRPTSKEYSSKTATMLLRTCMERASAVDTDTLAGKEDETDRYKLYEKSQEWEEVFVRISHRVGKDQSNALSCYKVVWQGFVDKQCIEYAGLFNILTFPDDVSLYNLHPVAKSLRQDCAKYKAGEINKSQWEKRAERALTRQKDEVLISIVAAKVTPGAIECDILTSSRSDSYVAEYEDFILWMEGREPEDEDDDRAKLEISWRCDDNQLHVPFVYGTEWT